MSYRCESTERCDNCGGQLKKSEEPYQLCTPCKKAYQNLGMQYYELVEALETGRFRKVPRPYVNS